jgi:preprotein translocase subunit SecG
LAGTLLVIQVILAILIVIVVLLQKSSSIGLGAYSGSNESVFGQKGSGGFLTKLTFSLAIAFVVNTLALGYVYNSENSQSVIDSISIPQGDSAIPQAPKE